MADEKAAEAEANDNKKKLPIKTIAVLAVVLIVEAVAIIGVFSMSGQPSDIQADPTAKTESDLAEQMVEELVVAEKFQNVRSGKPFIYDTEVYITMKRKHQADAASKLSLMSNSIREDIRTIFSRADPGHLDEPTLSTLERQIKAVLDSRLEFDVDTGDPIVESVIITKCIRYRSDF